MKGLCGWVAVLILVSVCGCVAAELRHHLVVQHVRYKSGWPSTPYIQLTIAVCLCWLVVAHSYSAHPSCPCCCSRRC